MGAKILDYTSQNQSIGVLNRLVEPHKKLPLRISSHKPVTPEGDFAGLKNVVVFCAVMSAYFFFLLGPVFLVVIMSYFAHLLAGQ